MNSDNEGTKLELVDLILLVSSKFVNFFENDRKKDIFVYKKKKKNSNKIASNRKYIIL